MSSHFAIAKLVVVGVDESVTLSASNILQHGGGDVPNEAFAALRPGGAEGEGFTARVGGHVLKALLVVAVAHVEAIHRNALGLELLELLRHARRDLAEVG